MNKPRSQRAVFLPTDPATARDPSAPYAVLPLPYERTVSYGTGTARGPAAILRASREVEDFDEELRIPLRLPVQTLPAPRFAGLGDRQALDRIRKSAARVLERGRFLLSLGGEHTVAVPLIAAARAVHGSLSVLHIDAHAGNRLSHACVVRRVRETGVRTVSVGIRNLSETEYDYITAERVPIVWAAEIAGGGDAWIETVAGHLRDPVYITVDVDAMDPGVIPATGTPDPGGLTWHQVTALLRKVCAVRRVVAADIVELAPIPGSVVGQYAAARLAAKILLYHREGRR
jgi:agmatinase